MPADRQDIRTSLDQSGKSLADLCRKAGIEYKRLSGIVNGYWYATPEEDKVIRLAIREFTKTTINEGVSNV